MFYEYGPSIPTVSYSLTVGVFNPQAFVHKSVMEELKRIIDDSEVMQEDDGLWPPPDRIGRQVGHHVT